VIIFFTQQNTIFIFYKKVFNFCSSCWQPLHYSVVFGHLEICRLLLDARADIHAESRCCSPRRSRHLPRSHSLHFSDGKTALQFAIDQKHPTVAAFLRSVGAQK
jgi:ankyrin repeat protein